MKVIQVLLPFFISLLFLSCKNDAVTEIESPEELPFQATVKWPSMDCGLYEIDVVNGVDELNAILQLTNNHSRFIANNLPSEYQVMELEIVFDARKCEAGELFPCTSQGPSYPWLYVTDVRKK